MLPKEIIDYCENKVNNNVDLNTLHEEIAKYNAWWCWLTEDRYLKCDTYDIDNYFFKDDNHICGTGEIAWRNRDGSWKKGYNIYYLINLQTNKLKIKAGSHFSENTFNSISDCFKYLREQFNKGDRDPFILQRSNKGSRLTLSDKQTNCLKKQLSNKLPEAFITSLIKSLSKREASKIITRLFCIEEIDTFELN